MKREGFDFDKKPHQIDKAFLKLFSPEEAAEIQEIWASINLMGASSTQLYRLPKTLQQAHLLMSHDRDRYVTAFDWIRDRVRGVTPQRILEVGCGSGILLRYLAESYPNIEYSGVDIEANLIEAAPAHHNVTLLAADYRSAPLSADHDMVICNFGFDLDRFPPSTKPHSIEQIGESKFCPGCSEDFAHEFGEYFKAWRQYATADASLLLVGRIRHFGDLRAIFLAAKEAGWAVDLGTSTVLEIRNADKERERFPALKFVSGASDAVSIEKLEAALRW